MDKEYEAVIGLEVHVQLATRSKMFCGCDAAVFAAEPNTHVCPVCTGQPGVLPVINRTAVEYAIMAGMALNCQIADFTKWDRKNYHYPDLPKGYQISQYDLPLSHDGWLTVTVDGQEKRIRVRRAHLEEDTGKSFHRGDHSLVDLNRSGVPLLEIVTEPDISSADEAYSFLTQLQTILRYLGVSSADMEKGAMRCEPNVSVRPVGQAEFGTQTEIKNLNSFRVVRASIAYEIERQIGVLEAGGRVERVTMGWDEQARTTVVQRSKEGAEDYRYFPEPDLPPVLVNSAWKEAIRGRLPELPAAKSARFAADYDLSPYDIEVLTADREVADYFEAAARAFGGLAKSVSNWVSGELFRLLNDSSAEIGDITVTPEALAELVSLVENGTINSSTGRDVLGEMFSQGTAAGEIVRRKGLAQISDQAALIEQVEQVIAAHPDEVAQYRSGKTGILQWLMGQVMRATRGKANPQVVQSLLAERLDSDPAE